MAITKRGDKGSALTYQEMDDNFDAITPRTSETGAVQIPAGTTGERPTGSEGHLRFNTASKQFEGFQGTVWTSVGAGGGGAGAPGPQGVQGPAGGGSGDGIQGERGIQGTDGIAIQGADGGPGIQGPAGSVQGLQGTDGNDGLGIQGSAGTPGATGPQGTAGEDGDPGVQGPAGSIQGLQGFQGFQGAGGGLGGQGVQGQAGSAQGIQGTEGNPGDEGTQGFQGFQGPAGLAQGVQGIQGGDGPAGFGFQGIQGGGGQGVQGLQGNDGPAGFGLQGMQGLQGDEGPGGTGPQGVQGVQGNPSNIPGPQGVEGPEGPQGTQGAQASQGVQGTQGADGVGDEGPQGIQGVMVQGITGDEGVQGLLGLQGIQGTVGVQGESVTGDTGIQGVQGLQGSVGENGFQGVQGPGIQGDAGVQGLAGEGNQGVQGFDAQGVQGSQGTQGTTLQGFQGTEGTPGFQGVQGIQAATVQGVQGPFGIQGPSDGVQGPEGPPGIQGPSDGAQGIQGTAGDNGVGVQGSSGGQGIQGLQGPSDGPQGPQGIQGIGLQGTTGAGTQGVQGVIGLQGPSDGADGNQGIQGTSGFQGASGSYGGTEFPYSWNTSTLGGDPGAGRFAADAANLQFATVLYIDDADSATVDIQSYLRTTDDPAGNVKGHIRVSPAGTPNQYVLYSISTVTEETGFFEIGVVWEAGNRTSFTNQTDLIISFERAGAIGTQGAQGLTGAGVQGLIGPQGIQGMQGVQGLQGISEAGTQGLQGLQGPEAQDPDVSADTSPQLGGDLDVNGQSIVSVSNGNIQITPDGTGSVILDGLSYPADDGTNGQVLTTDGSGNLSFADASGGGLTVMSTTTVDNPNAYDTSASDNFSRDAVAISGNYAIVGAYAEDDAGGSSSGKAYILDVTTGALVHTLDNPNAYNTSAFDYFGRSVSISGNYAIVGAYGEDNATGSTVGKAYIYDVTTGALVHTLDNPNAYGTSDSEWFGHSVAISDNYAIVGAHFEDDASGNNSGKAYIFNVTTGNLVHTLDNPNAYGTSTDDIFGYRVAISGNYAIVGAKDEDDASFVAVGKAYIFNVTTGALVHTLDNPNAYDTSYADFFGSAVAISGDYAIVGASDEDDAGGSGSGKAYIFNVTTGALVHTLDNPNAYSTSASDLFGISVAISGNYAIVGAELEDDAGGTSSGKAYIFNVTTGSLAYTLDNPNAYGTSASDYFGNAVAISGNCTIVGARLEDDAGGTQSGKAYIFRTNAQPYTYTGAEIASFSDGISLAVLKTEVAASTDFADFQTRIAAL